MIAKLVQEFENFESWLGNVASGNQTEAAVEKAPRYHGVWSHFMDGESGQTLPVFDMFDNGGDLVDSRPHS